LMAKVPTARMFTLEAPQATSCAAARMDAGGTLSTIIKGRQCDSPPDICVSRQLSATEPLFSAPWGEARLGRAISRCRLRLPPDRATPWKDDDARSSVRTWGGRAVAPSPWIVVAFWIAAVVATVLRLCNLADLSRYERRRKNHRGDASKR